MKKLFKILPLVIVPFLLASCDALKLGGLGGETSSSESGSGTGEGGDPTDTNVYPSSLTISGADSVKMGSTTTLTATYIPSNVTDTKVSWSSSDTTVATISSSGKVTPKKIGDFTITASMKGPNSTKVTATKDMTVSYANITKITLNLSSKNLGYGDSVNLTATVNANSNPNINWTTSNSTIASLNHSQTSSGEAVTVTAGNSDGTATITAKSAVDSSVYATCTINVSDDPIDKMTVMVYVCGADLESDTDSPGYQNSGRQGLASMDIDEMLSVSGQPDDVNIVLETGGASKWVNSAIESVRSKGKMGRWSIRNQALVKEAEITKVSMGDGLTLQEFMEWGINTYPAEKYGLILWNHGGAMDGCCFDETAGKDSLSLLEVYNACSGARNNCGITGKLDWITYDACLMAVQDVAEYNSFNFNYMLASQESESGYGYDYDAWLPTLYSNPSINGGDLLQVIGETFLIEEKEIYDYWGEPFDQTQSVFDLSYMSAYKTAMEDFASDLYDIIKTNNTKAKNLGNLINGAQKYGYDSTTYYDYVFDIFDVESAINKIIVNSNFSSTATKGQAVIDAIDDLIYYEDHGDGTTGCGVCLYCPMKYKSKYDSYYGPSSNLTNWKKVANKVADQF